jgi:hypothetical protein
MFDWVACVASSTLYRVLLLKVDTNYSAAKGQLLGAVSEKATWTLLNGPGALVLDLQCYC